MPCTPFVLDGGGVGIVCTKGRRGARCAFCQGTSSALCDYPTTPGHTCSKPCCPTHAHQTGADVDLCSLHAPPRRRTEHPFGTDVYAPLVTHPVPHGPGCPRCDAGLCHGCTACRGQHVHRLAGRRLPGPWVAVVGARDHGNLAQLDAHVDGLSPDTVVVSGGARGTDGYGVARARARGLRTVVLEADWERNGKSAGFLRNSEVVSVVDRLVAATWWGCRGTLDTLAKAEAVGLGVTRVKPLASQLEVWTARLSPRPDPDLLDVTNMTGRAHTSVLAERWQKLAPAARPRELVRELRRWGEATPLVELQRRARAEHAPSVGALWAPSTTLLFKTLPLLDALSVRAERAELALVAARLTDHTAIAVRDAAVADVQAEAAVVWEDYRTAFMAEMRQRFARFPEAWGWLLGRRRVVLACACVRPSYLPPDAPWTRCHRFLVAEALGKCGARTMGELPAVNPSPDQLTMVS